MDTQTLLTLSVLIVGFIVLGLVLRSQQRPADNSSAINQAVATGLRQLIEANEQQRTSTSTAVGEQLATVRTALDELKRQNAEWDTRRSEAIGALSQVAQSTREQVARLNEETAGLSGAMRGNQTRGKWGEISLRNVIESIGMLEHVDFNEQVQQLGEGTGRPDVTVRLPGGRVMYIDSKVPWSSYQQSLGETDPGLREALLRQNAKDIKGHIDALAARDYRSALEALSYVVMFVPVESALSAALVAEPDLIDYATRKGVVLASVASLIVILSNFHQAWDAQAKIDNVDRIVEASDELVKRLGDMVNHLDKVGDGLRKAGRAYNDAVGSYNTRVVPQVGKLDALRVRSIEAREVDGVDFEPRALRSAAKDAGKGDVEEIRLAQEPDQGI